MGIFNFFGSIFGYLLWFLYEIFSNFGISIILFSIIVKVLMFPLTIKQQRSMAGQAKLTKKQQELQKIYANDKTKYNVELQKLYEKEGANPGSGCVTSLITLPIMLGIYYAVIAPLSNTLHIASDKIADAVTYIEQIPGSSAIMSSTQQELAIISNWSYLRNSLTMFDAADIAKIDFFADGFEFLGLNLLMSPSGSTFADMLWLIPICSLISAFAMSFISMRNSAMPQQGCTKYMMYGLPLLSAYWAFIFPAAVGLYWVVSSLTSGIQTMITHKFFSATHLSTQKEAVRFVTMLDKEQKTEQLPLKTQMEIRQKLEDQINSAKLAQKQNNTQSSKKKKNSKKPVNKTNNDYLGNKK